MNLGLKELISQARSELLALEKESAALGINPIVKLDSLTVEANIVVEKSTATKGGFDIKVVSVGGGENFSETQTHKITVGLSVPKDLFAHGVKSVLVENTPDEDPFDPTKITL